MADSPNSWDSPPHKAPIFVSSSPVQVELELNNSESPSPPAFDPVPLELQTALVSTPGGLPFEVLERIFRYTFLRPAPVTPSSNPFPLRGTTHILLVSKLIRRLALPSFLHSITIADPDNFLTFFGSKEGIFVVGKDARLKWSYVREICLVSDPKLPLSTPTRANRATTKCLASLQLPQTNFLERFCFLDYYADFGFLYQLQKAAYKDFFEKEVQKTLTGFVRRLASDGTVLVLTSDFLKYLPTNADFGTRALGIVPKRLEVHDTLSLNPDQAQEFIKEVKHVITEWKPVHLVGFSPLFVFRFGEEVEKMKKTGVRLEFTWDV